MMHDLNILKCVKAVSRWMIRVATGALLLIAATTQCQTRSEAGKYGITLHDRLAVEETCLPQKYTDYGRYLLCEEEETRCLLAAKKLRYFEGRWELTGDIRADQHSGTRRFSRVEQGTWNAANRSLVMRWRQDGPKREMAGTTIYVYDNERKHYLRSDSAGGVSSGSGELKGGSWTWSAIVALPDGKRHRARWTMDEVSPALYRFTIRIPSAGGAWELFAEGIAKRIRSQ